MDTFYDTLSLVTVLNQVPQIDILVSYTVDPRT
jgi:hypothetical protein